MVLNNIGTIVYEQWYLSEKIRKNIILDEFIIMPNHIHGIVVVDNGSVGDRGVLEEHLYTGKHPKMSKISPKKTSVSHMIREFKSAVTKNVRQFNPDFSWQSKFHDHIIRNEISLNNIRRYIKNNPKMWNKNKDNNMGLKM